MKKLFFKTWNIAHKRKWNQITIACDIHDVILGANYKAGDIPKNFLGDAKKVLQRLSKREDTTLVLFTCSHPHEIIEYQQFFKENDINFKYVNENLDCPNTAFGCFEKKFYFNILLEDKAGFDANEDWAQINEALDEIDKWSVVEVESEQLLVNGNETIGYCTTTSNARFIESKDCKVIGPLDITKYTGR